MPAGSEDCTPLGDYLPRCPLASRFAERGTAARRMNAGWGRLIRNDGAKAMTDRAKRVIDRKLLRIGHNLVPPWA
jgi:hypothetical protein